LLESLVALRRENKDVLWSSMVKDTMKRKKPSFNETYHGYRTFSELLQDAEKEGLVELDVDKRSKTFVVTRFGAELKSAPRAEVAVAEIGPPKKRRKRSRGRSGRSADSADKKIVAANGSAPVQESLPIEATRADDTAPPRDNEE
jgi:hypothetical protein